MQNTHPLLIPILIGISLLILNLAFPSSLKAQMFSVGDPEPVQSEAPGIYSIIGVSWEPASFSYKGDDDVQLDRVDFDDPILRFRFESPGLELTLGLGGNITGMNNNSYTNISGRIYNHLTLYRKENFNLHLPIQITTDLKRVRRENTEFEFQQSSFTFGSGLGAALRLGQKIDLNLKATPNYGFSFSQGNLFGGSLLRFDGRTYLVLRNLIGRRSVALGYHYDFRSYDVDGEQNDYDFTSHSFTLGIAF